MSLPLALIHEARVVSLAGRAVQIGRLPECDIMLDGPEVSRRHARVVPTPEGPLIVDRSRYGTLVNGSHVVAPQLLHEGDVLQVGPWVLRVSRAAPTADDDSATGWRGRLRQWRRRYGLSEVIGTIAAVAVAVATRRATGSVVVAAYAGTLAEAVWSMAS
jgi:FHA domain